MKLDSPTSTIRTYILLVAYLIPSQAFVPIVQRCCSSTKYTLRRAAPLKPSKSESISRPEPVVPVQLLEALGERRLLPVQEAAFELVRNGGDAVIHAPTGSGKTLAYALPLTAKLLASGIATKAEHAVETEASGNSISMPKAARVPRRAPPGKPVLPRTVCVVPSRELARQVGKAWSEFYPNKVATVFGGAPVERHAYMLRAAGGADVVVGTAGRLRELVREGHLGFGKLKTLVLDEADILLNAKDQPDVAAFLDNMDHDYQLVLCSATINAAVRAFARDIMEIEKGSPNFVTVGITRNQPLPSSVTSEGGTDGSAAHSTGGGAAAALLQSREGSIGSSSLYGAPLVRHWSTAVRVSARAGVAADLVSTLNPRTAIVFVATKVECDAIAEEFGALLAGTKVLQLHGDMPQPARARTLTQLRASPSASNSTASSSHQAPCRVLVATDVASRGLDLPGVDLVVQLGAPRKAGKEGTVDAELYTHRAGRAGRVGGDKGIAADAVLLYDPTKGETAQTANLAATLAKQGVHLAPRPPPAPQQVLDAAFQRALERASSVDPALSEAFITMLRRSRATGAGASIVADEKSELALAQALAALSGLFKLQPPRSLLTADQNDRTVRVWRTNDEEALKQAKIMAVEVEMQAPVETEVEEKDAKKSKKKGAAAAPKASSKLSSKSSNGGEFTVVEEDEEAEGQDGPNSAAAGVNDDGPSNLVRPAEVTRLVKALGLGKIGRAELLSDGSVVFDMPSAKAEALLTAANAAAAASVLTDSEGGLLAGGLRLELPGELPS